MRTLPVIGSLGHAIRSTIDNIAFAFHISWPWIVLLLPLNIGANLYFAMKGFQTPAQFDTAASTISFVLGVANLLIYSSIAINWHRYVLLDEIPAGWSRMRLDSLTWRYFFNLIGNVILIFLMSFVLFIPVGILMGLMGGMRTEIHGLPAFVIITLSLPLVAFVFVAFYRISVKLPSIALGRHDFGIRDAWKVTAGNFWPLLGLIVLFFICIIFVLLAMLLATFILVNFGVFGLSISLAAQVLVNWIVTILGVTLLTSLYGFFVEGRDF